MAEINQETAARPKRNLLLIGFMGSGKTVIGRQTARLLNFEFVDTDEQIQQVTGMTLVQLYKKHGEIRFRSEEELVIKKLAQREGLVVASGGSLMIQQTHLRQLQPEGYFVLLEAKPEVILSRLSRKNNRPLLSNKPTLETIEALLAERRQQYLAMADFVLDTAELSVEEAAEAIALQFRTVNG